MIFSSLDVFVLKREAKSLVEITELKPGWSVAEVGAGQGRLVFLLSKYVGAGGVVYATEFDAKKLNNIAKKAKRLGLANVVTLESGSSSANLPENKFNLIILRKVYHHITQPVEMNQSFFNALRRGGKLVIVDFSPKWFLKLSTPKGIPENRGGHGIGKNIVIDEIISCGLELNEVIEPWSKDGLYCLVFEKPLI